MLKESDVIAMKEFDVLADDSDVAVREFKR